MTDFSPTFQHFLSIAVIIAIAAFVLFVFSLFLTGGPYVRGFYTPNTALKSAGFDYRRRDPNFDGKAWLKAHPEPQTKPWGGTLIMIDCNKIGNALTCGKANREQKETPKVNLDNLYDEPESIKDPQSPRPEEEQKSMEESPAMPGDINNNTTDGGEPPADTEEAKKDEV